MRAEQERRIHSLEIKNTADGSPTLYVPELNEHYHSVHGALQESLHVFINGGLRPAIRKNLSEIKVFEVGFGTGLNALTTYAEVYKTGPMVKYTAIETFPIPVSLINNLTIGGFLNGDGLKQVFVDMHLSAWETENKFGDNFTLYKIQNTLQEAVLPAEEYNIIYFDAFAPEKQPELWEENIFRKLMRTLQPGGSLVTYCAKGIVKRRLREVGFDVETLPGPPGKREMISALRRN